MEGKVADLAEILVDKPMDKIRINVWLSQEMHEDLGFLSRRDGRSVSDLIREAVRDLLKKDAG